MSVDELTRKVNEQLGRPPMGDWGWKPFGNLITLPNHEGVILAQPMIYCPNPQHTVS